MSHQDFTTLAFYDKFCVIFDNNQVDGILITQPYQVTAEAKLIFLTGVPLWPDEVTTTFTPYNTTRLKMLDSLEHSYWELSVNF